MSQRQAANNPVLNISLQKQLSNEVVLNESINYCYDTFNYNKKLDDNTIPLVKNCINTFMVALSIGDDIMAQGFQ